MCSSFANHSLFSYHTISLSPPPLTFFSPLLHLPSLSFLSPRLLYFPLWFHPISSYLPKPPTPPTFVTSTECFMTNGQQSLSKKAFEKSFSSLLIRDFVIISSLRSSFVELRFAWEVFAFFWETISTLTSTFFLGILFLYYVLFFMIICNNLSFC